MQKKIISLSLIIISSILVACSEKPKTYEYYAEHIDEAEIKFKTCKADLKSKKEHTFNQECLDAIKALRMKNRAEAEKSRQSATYGDNKVDSSFYP